MIQGHRTAAPLPPEIPDHATAELGNRNRNTTDIRTPDGAWRISNTDADRCYTTDLGDWYYDCGCSHKIRITVDLDRIWRIAGEPRRAKDQDATTNEKIAARKAAAHLKELGALADNPYQR